MKTGVRRAGAIGKSVVTLVLIVVVQGILAYRFSVFGYFDLPLIYCVYYGFVSSNPFTSVFVGSSLGLLQDSLAGTLVGTNGFSKTAICFAAASTGLKFNVDQGVTRTISLFLFTFVDALIVTILNLTLGGGSESLYGGRLGDLALSGVFNTLLGLMVFGLHDRFGNAA